MKVSRFRPKGKLRKKIIIAGKKKFMPQYTIRGLLLIKKGQQEKAQQN